jgi:DNA-binding response OmpR family regulator
MGRKKILVVDDEPKMVTMLKMALEAASYEVVAASNGQEGIEKVEGERPDAIILDLMMPEMDGFTACKKIKGNPEYAHIPILVLTGISEQFSSSRYSKSMGLELEAEDYIDKPFDPNILLERLARLLKKS